MKKIIAFMAIFQVIMACKKECSEDCPKPENTLPQISTIAVTEITDTSAKFHGALLKIGDTAVSDFGFCWSATAPPTINNSKVSKGNTKTTQSFSNLVTTLEPDKTYFLRAYATNSLGTAYGEQLSFKTKISSVNEGLVAYYPFNGNTLDESGNNNHGTPFGGALANDRKGNSNNAYNFNGAAYIKVNNSLSLSSVEDNFTISAWVYNESTFVSVVCKSAYSGNTMQFRLFSDAKIFFANNGKAADFNSTLNPLNIWKHIAITSNGTIAKYYLNGVEVSSISLTEASNSNDHGTEMYIGADTHGPTEMMTGKLDEIRIYSRALSSSEINKIFRL